MQWPSANAGPFAFSVAHTMPRNRPEASAHAGNRAGRYPTSQNPQIAPTGTAGATQADHEIVKIDHGNVIEGHKMNTIGTNLEHNWGLPSSGEMEDGA